MSKKYLVTGSNGLVGGAIKELLGDGHIYHTRERADFLNKEETFEFFKKAVEEGVNSVIHCAARVGGVKANSSDNKGFFDDNMVITDNVISACYELRIENFVNLLSTCIFPDTSITYPLTADQIENGRPHPSNYGYSYAKRFSGYKTRTYRDVTGWNWINVVPTNVYGDNDNYNLEKSHVIPGMIHKAYLASVEKSNLVIWGDGKPLRQFIHAKDLAVNILWAIDNWKSELPFMCINEKEHSIKEIACLIAKEFGIAEERITFDTNQPKGQHRKPARSDVPPDYKFTDIKDGIRTSCNWFRDNLKGARK
jgi:GDP-L-fucose synthase